MTKIIRQSQLALPLLELLADHPKGLTASDAVLAIAEKLNIPEEIRTARARLPGGQSVDLFARDVRWARQKAKDTGHIDGSIRNLWRSTPKGKNDLRNATPGVVITVYETAHGRAIWAEAESAFGTIKDKSVNLWFTSTPYDLVTKKNYQASDDLSGAAYIDWLTAIVAEMARTLTDDGSIVLNLGDAFIPGRPVTSLYQERLIIRLVDELGLKVPQKLQWWNPAKMPSPAQWVTVKRCRVTPATENLWWLSKTDFPKANNRKVLRPYSEQMKRTIAAGGARQGTRPSGHTLTAGAFSADNGGSIPHNLIIASNTSSNDPYSRYCRDKNLPIHPARFPSEIVDFAVNLMTDKDDLVADCFAGSNKTGARAEHLGRRWLSIERSLTNLQGSAGHFPHANYPPA